MKKRISNMGEIIFAITAAITLCGMQIQSLAEVDPQFDSRWQHVAMKYLLSEPLENEEAIVWHLDYNGFAVRLPNCLLIFDYNNQIPAPQYEKRLGTEPVKSMLTGVINPEELKDEDVVFFFSHKHPAEKIIELLPWKDILRKVTFVMTEDTFLKNEEAILAFNEKDKSEFGRKDALSVIHRIHPNHTYVMRGHTVTVAEVPAILNPGRKEPYTGVEFIIRTANGLTVYHSGSFMCRHCADLKMVEYNLPENLPKKHARAPRVISADTQSLSFKNGGIVAINKEQLDLPTQPAGTRRIALAVYTDPNNLSGSVLMATTCVPEFSIGVVGGRSYDGLGGTKGHELRKLREKNAFLKEDAFLAERNPTFDADIGWDARLEYEKQELSAYFEALEGNTEILRTLKNIAIQRNAAYQALVRENCGQKVTPQACDKHANPRKFHFNVYPINYDPPSLCRGECDLVTTNYERRPSPYYFMGYFGEIGFPLVIGDKNIDKIYQEYK